MKHFCTIITADHLYKALALYDSLVKYEEHTCLHILCIDDCPNFPSNTGLRLYSINDISSIDSAKTIHAKYAKHPDKLRWSLKPVFLYHLINTLKNKVIYLDTDLYFYRNFDFLFDLLNEHTVLLTPHHYSRDPTQAQNWFEANFRVGLFNAGFVGVSTQASALMEWWAACCAYRCEKNALRGTFDDQRYLDLLPVMDERVHILRHKGCNVADWNRQENPRQLKNNEVMLSGKDPLIFIHFNYTTIRSITQNKEPLLKAHLDTYFKNLLQYKPDLALESMYGEDKFIDKLKYKVWQIVTRWGW